MTMEYLSPVVRQVVEAVRKHHPYTDRTRDFHDRVQDALAREGWATSREVSVTYSPNRNDGRIDIVAAHACGIVAIECDNRSPRRKSFRKLLAYPATARLIVLRRSKAVEMVDCVAVFGVEVQRE